MPTSASAAPQQRVEIVAGAKVLPLVPRNIYGVTKLAAEELCRLFHQLHKLPIVILRTSRFFPEEDDMAHAISQSGENTKADEFLFRRLTVEDAAEAHVVALAKAPAIGFDAFIVSSMTPFSRADCSELIVVVANCGLIKNPGSDPKTKRPGKRVCDQMRFPRSISSPPNLKV